MPHWKVMLVDHSQLFCAALRALLGNSAFEVAYEVSDLDRASHLLLDGASPDLILVDFQTGDDREIAQFRRLRDVAADARLVVLAAEMSPHLLGVALRNGADGYLDKSMSCEGLERSLHLVMLGEAVFPARISDLLPGGSADAPAPANGPSTGGELSKREIEILRCLLAGQSNKTIARNLRITESTVKMHFKNVMRKIHAQNRTQAAVWAIQHGIAPRAAS